MILRHSEIFRFLMEFGGTPFSSDPITTPKPLLGEGVKGRGEGAVFAKRVFPKRKSFRNAAVCFHDSGVRVLAASGEGDLQQRRSIDAARAFRIRYQVVLGNPAGVGDAMGAGGLQQTARHPASLALLGLMPGAISAARHELFRPPALRSLVKHDIALAHTPAVSYRKCTIFQRFRTLAPLAVEIARPSHKTPDA